MNIWSTDKIMNRMDEMLDRAIAGEAPEKVFDETKMSALETKLQKYLSANQVSKQHLEQQKKKINELVSDISHQTKTPIANLLLYSELLAERLEVENTKNVENKDNAENVGNQDSFVCLSDECELAQQTNSGSDSCDFRSISSGTKQTETKYCTPCKALTDEKSLNEMKQIVNAIHAQTEKLSFLIQTMVTISRLENGIIQTCPAENDVQPLITACINQLREKAEAKHIKLTACETDAKAFFDEKWTSEALCNIIDNAVKYTETGGSIEIKVSEYQMFTRIDVKDNGIGIPEQEQSKVFQRFYRGEEVQQQEGIGLGLYLAREIVTDQGGYIKLQSKPGEGTAFSVFLAKDRKEPTVLYHCGNLSKL